MIDMVCEIFREVKVLAWARTNWRRVVASNQTTLELTLMMILMMIMKYSIFIEQL